MATDAQDVSFIRFLTGSSYEGSWNDSVHMMDGFGTYHYPDGSEYRGRFSEGKFHGYGQLKLALPHHYTIRGEFNMGKLVNIEDMWFNDGLYVQGSFRKDNFISDKWNYLTPGDRRYQAERFYGLQPVGPTSYLTSSLLVRTVPPNCYDVEEGHYNAQTSWLTDRQPPFSKTVYVSCPEEKKWIMRHCRTERKENITEPLPSFCRRIIENNLNSERGQIKDITIYAPKNNVQRELYFPKVCHNQIMEEEDPENAKPPFRTPPFQTKRNRTELCLKKHFEIEQQAVKKSRFLGKETTLERARVWSSTSDIPQADSGSTQSISKSPSEASLCVKIKDIYDDAILMLQKIPTDSLQVVQSNLNRPSGFVEGNQSTFDL